MHPHTKRFRFSSLLDRNFLLFFSLFFLLSSLFLSGCTMTRRPSTSVDRTVSITSNCKFSDDPFSPVWTFYLGSDNRILKMELRSSLTKREIEKVYPDATEEEVTKIYLEYGKKQDEDYTYLSTKYPSKKWLTRSWKFDDTALEFEAYYLFDVSFDGFNYTLESSLFKDFSLDTLWNEEKQGFYYNESTIKSALFGNAGVCADKTEKDFSIKDLTPKKMPDQYEGESSNQSGLDDAALSELFGNTGNTGENNEEIQEGDNQEDESKKEEGKDAGEKESPADASETDTKAPSQNQSSNKKPNVQDVNENVSIFEQFGLGNDEE